MPARRVRRRSSHQPKSEWYLYLHTFVLGVILFTGIFFYTTWLKIPNPLNKTVADVAAILIGLSMLLSSVCYFWNYWDAAIVYRKHLGLVGFALAIVHLLLSWDVFLGLFRFVTWQSNGLYPVLTAFLATVIFTVMAAISNELAARVLGYWWRIILRTGYLALALVLIHVVLLKGTRWVTWWEEGASRPPSASLLVSLFMVIVIVMRGCLWYLNRSRR